MSTKEFSMAVFSRRHGHRDSYHITRTEGGWHVAFLSHNGECNKRGEPVLFNSLIHDSINYPADLGMYLEHLWGKVDEKDLSDEDIQNALNQLADWVSTCERTTPKGNFFGEV